MAGILRGYILWADLDPTPEHEQAGIRPVLVLSQNVFTDRSGTMIAIALTSQKPNAGFPLTFELSDPSLPKLSCAKIGQISTLSTQRIGTKLGKASNDEMEMILEGLNEMLGN
jgi:mRNA interferase MazF